MTLAGNIGLSAIKVIAGVMSNSVGLTVDGFHSLSDAIGTVFVLLSLRVADKPSDDCHPYGHGKIEFIASLAVYSVLFIVGGIFLLESSLVLIVGRETGPRVMGFLVAMISVLANYVMYNFLLCAGEKINSPSLVANGHENLTDMYSSFPVALGILASQFGFYFCDALAGVIVSFLILNNALRGWWESLQNLIDRSAQPATLKRIHAIATSIEGVLGTANIRTRRLGQNLWIDMEVRVAADSSVEEASRIASEVRGRLLRKAKHVEDVCVSFSTGGLSPACEGASA